MHFVLKTKLEWVINPGPQTPSLKRQGIARRGLSKASISNSAQKPNHNQTTPPADKSRSNTLDESPWKPCSPLLASRDHIRRQYTCRWTKRKRPAHQKNHVLPSHDSNRRGKKSSLSPSTYYATPNESPEAVLRLVLRAEDPSGLRSKSVSCPGTSLDLFPLAFFWIEADPA